MYVHEYHMKESCLRFFYLGPSSHFMKSRKKSFKYNVKKLPVF